MRELNIYTMYLPYQLEGEITAKIHIPSHCLELPQKYEGATAWKDLAAGTLPTPIHTDRNPNYAAPALYANVRFVQ